MTDRPIIFSAPMIRALLREVESPGTGKRMTRRILKPQPEQFVVDKETGKLCHIGLLQTEIDLWPRVYLSSKPDTGGVVTRQEVRFKPGMRLWVRESFATHRAAAARVYAKGDGHPWGSPIYRATFAGGLLPECEGFTKWRSPIHMPHWASRLTLHVEAVKIERLQDITEEDAKAEGIERHPHSGGGCWYDYAPSTDCLTPVDSFVTLWNSLHGPDAWAENPSVVAISFRPEPHNIAQERG